MGLSGIRVGIGALVVAAGLLCANPPAAGHLADIGPCTNCGAPIYSGYGSPDGSSAGVTAPQITTSSPAGDTSTGS